METLFIILVCLGCISSIMTTVMIFFLGAFIARESSLMKEFFSDLVNMISGIEPVAVPIESPKQKTWDEKYEEDLADRDRRFREESDVGLIDLARPTSNYGVAPAANPQAQEGLILRSREGNMR